MAAPRPNLARRPFVDTRPANLAAALLLAAAIGMTFVSVKTVGAYVAGSKTSREAIAGLRAEIAGYEEARREAETKLARFDLAGMKAGAEEANALARLRTFSWTRFLTRLEKTLPNDARVVSMGLSREGQQKTASGVPGAADGEAFALSLSLVSRDPDGMPKLIRAFYASPWFDAPTPVYEAGGEQGSVEGRSLSISVLYRDREVKP
jgi:Tfp pilus assembly protein PilN